MIANSPYSERTNNLAKTQDKVAVLLAGYGGVEKYDQFTQYNQRAEKYISGKFAPIPSFLYPLLARILTLRDLYKWKYKHSSFTSPQNDIFEKQRIGIEQLLQQQWGDSVTVFKGFYFCPPYLKDVMAEIKAQGFNKLLIYPLLVVKSIFTSDIAVQQVNEYLEDLNEKDETWPQSLRYLPSFSDRPDYINLLVSQIKEEIESTFGDRFSPSQIGIILETHGGPQKTQGLNTGVQGAQELYNQVQEKLINQYPLISVGWINHDTPFIKWTEPTLEEAGKNLIELGAKAILFKPIGWATGNFETILEVEEAIDTLKQKHPTLTYERMECVNDSPEFLKMAAEWANPQIEALLASSTAIPH
ncbi:MAG: ferrochelatase [Halothece sp.]